MGKITDLSELARIVPLLVNDGKIIVTTNGVFDLFHAGHVAALDFAKQQGDFLLVGVNSDSSAKACKGKTPIISCENRMKVIEALHCVDYVFSFPEPDPRAFLEIIRPHVHVNSAEYGENCVEAETVRKHGGKLVLYPRVLSISTTQIIARIRQGDL